MNSIKDTSQPEKTPSPKTENLGVQPEVITSPNEINDSAPYWKKHPCPAWCTSDHRDAKTFEIIDDAYHVGSYDLCIILSTEGTVAPSDYSLFTVMASLWQHYLNKAPSVDIVFYLKGGGETDLHFTLLEASALADGMQKLAREANSEINHKAHQSELVTRDRLDDGRPYWQTSPCPSWCAAFHGNFHGIGEAFHVSEPSEKFLLSANTHKDKEESFHPFLSPIEASLALKKHHLESSPRVMLKISSQNKEEMERNFTIPEADFFSKGLTKLVESGKKGIQ